MFTFPWTAWAQVACMVSNLNGEAMLIRSGETPAGLTKFRKLQEGDTVRIASGAALSLSFLVKGTVESWRGPAILEITMEGAKADPAAKTPETASLDVGTAFIKDSSLFDDQKELVTGQFLVRGISWPQDAPLTLAEREQLKNAKAEFERLASSAPEGDVFSDMYYLAVLERLGQKRTMAEHISLLLENDKNNSALEEMLQNIR
jgi:hypothetical protein